MVAAMTARNGSGATITGQQSLYTRFKLMRDAVTGIATSRELAEILKTRILDRFDRNVDEKGVPWMPLKQSTIERRERRGYGGDTPLNESGSLRRSIAVIKGRADGLYAINTGLSVRIGIDDPDVATYAKIHNRGGRSGMYHHKIPARPYLRLSAEDAEAVRGVVIRKITAAIKVPLHD